jgi:hypothetical protein
MPTPGWENNIEMHLEEIACDGVNWIQLAQDRVPWRALVNTVIDFRLGLICRGAEKTLVFLISYFPICSTTKRIFLGWVK